MFLCGFYELVCVRGAGAVRVAGDELRPFSAFVVHRVAQRARQRHQEANERDAEDEDAAREVEASASRDLWEESIAVVFFFGVCLVTFFTPFKRRGGGRERRVVVREGARPGVAELRQIVRS